MRPVHYVDAECDTWEFVSLDGVPVMWHYTVDGAPFRPECRRAVPGRSMARRFTPARPGERGRPAQRVLTTDGDRSQDLPLLSGRTW
jgi:hypothetical protein